MSLFYITAVVAFINTAQVSTTCLGSIPKIECDGCLLKGLGDDLCKCTPRIVTAACLPKICPIKCKEKLVICKVPCDDLDLKKDLVMQKGEMKCLLPLVKPVKQAKVMGGCCKILTKGELDDKPDECAVLKGQVPPNEAFIRPDKQVADPVNLYEKDPQPAEACYYPQPVAPVPSTIPVAPSPPVPAQKYTYPYGKPDISYMKSSMVPSVPSLSDPGQMYSYPYGKPDINYMKPSMVPGIPSLPDPTQMYSYPYGKSDINYMKPSMVPAVPSLPLQAQMYQYPNGKPDISNMNPVNQYSYNMPSMM